jgi:glucose-1-phosphate cytidylyltransferase
MKAVILAGGLGTRMSETTAMIPKPMVEIGGKPILWHIMKIYSQYNISEFIICCGYKQFMMKEYFANYFLNHCDLTIDLANNDMQILNHNTENWKVTLIDTGLNTMTGGRIKRVQKYVGNETFLLTYGDGVADIHINETVQSHKKSGKILTMTAFQHTIRLGVLNIDKQELVESFTEKPAESDSWINAGFFVCEPQLFDYIENDFEMLEREPMDRLMKEKQIHAYKHHGFWKPMDTMRDNLELNDLWNQGKAPWKIWE